MKTMKMKALAVAVLGLAAGNAMAVCANIGGNPSVAGGGSWSFRSAVNGIAAIADGGYNNTGNCHLDAQITANLGSASAFVRDDTPSAEPHYRARFFINADNLTGLNSTQPVRIFAALTEVNNPPQGVPEVIKLSIFGNAGGTNKVLGVATACATGGFSGVCSTSVPLGNTGTHSIEIEWVKDPSGFLKVWVDNTVANNPNANLSVDNSAWGGVDSAAMGLASASPGFRTGQLNRAVGFDEFDSRRSTGIAVQ